MSESKKRVAVLMGGWSSEREVSLISGSAICKAVEELGHELVAIDVQRDPEALIQALTKQAGGKIDVIINGLHGRFGEDGTIQGLLDFIGIPYTHSGLLASAVAMDKPMMRILAEGFGVRCAEGCVVTRTEILEKGYPLELPFVIKPTNEGSSVGVRVVKTQEQIDAIEEDGWVYGDEVLLESFIPGHELTVSVLGDKEEAKALAVTELRPLKNDFYDYSSKYSDGMTEHIIPAPIPEEIAEETKRLSILLFKSIGCHGAARADFRWDDSLPGTEGLYFLEINTQPGMTPLSLVPEQAKHVGMSFNDLIAWMMEHPICPA